MSYVHDFANVITDFGACGDGVTDDTEAIQAAVDAARVVYFPPGDYVVRHRQQLHGVWNVGVVVPAGRRLVGDGYQSKIHTRLLSTEPVDIRAMQSESHWNVVSWFWVTWGADNVEFERLHFVGEVPEGTPVSQHILSLQPGVIGVASTHTTHGPAPANQRTRYCWFSNQYGFTVHAAAGGDGIVFEGNVSRDCMNGANLNGHYQRCVGNYFLRAEGFECTGRQSVYAYNVMRDVSLGFSLGGDMSNGTHGYQFGATCIGNVVDGVLPIEGGHTQQAIVVADNMFDVLVSQNIIHRSASTAIQIATQGGTARPIQRVKVLDNIIVGCQATAISCSTGVSDVEIDGNLITDQHSDGTPIYAGVGTPQGIATFGTVADVRIGSRNRIRITGATPFYLASAVDLSVAPRTEVFTPDGAATTVGLDAANFGSVFWRLTTTANRTISAPLNALRGHEMHFVFENASGGSIGAITFDAAFLRSGGTAFTPPADTKRRMIAFRYDGTNWVELWRSNADV